MNAAVRELVRRRAGDRCEYCRLPQHAVPFATFHVEHIRAKQHGGLEDPENLALSCDRCNAFKGPNLTAIDPSTKTLVSLYNPRTQRWSEHFKQVGFELAGLTDIGRATVTLLNMNAPHRVRLRMTLGIQLDAP
jgi:hypothetical protein